MLRSVRDLVHLRWRTAQVLMAAVEGNAEQVRSLRQAMRVEQLDDPDMRDEIRLLLRQFGHRTPVYLSEEASRLWRQLLQFCTRCGRASQHRDNTGVCHRCILEES